MCRVEELACVSSGRVAGVSSRRVFSSVERKSLFVCRAGEFARVSSRLLVCRVQELLV